MLPREKAEEIHHQYSDIVLYVPFDGDAYDLAVFECGNIFLKNIIQAFDHIFDDYISYDKPYEGYHQMRLYWIDVQKEFIEIYKI